MPCVLSCVAGAHAMVLSKMCVFELDNVKYFIKDFLTRN